MDILTSNKETNEDLNILINKIFEEEINGIKTMFINIVNYENQIKLLRNELISKKYENFRLLFKKLYDNNYFEEMDNLFYDIIGFDKKDIVLEATANGIFYIDSGIKNIPDAINSLNMSKGDILTDIGSGPGFLGIFLFFYSGISFNGIELNSELINIGLKIINDFGIGNNVKLFNIDALDYNYDYSEYIYLFRPLRIEPMNEILLRLKKNYKKELKIFNYGGLTQINDYDKWLIKKETKLGSSVYLKKNLEK